MQSEAMCLNFKIENIEMIRIIYFKVSFADLCELDVLHTCEVVCYF